MEMTWAWLGYWLFGYLAGAVVATAAILYSPTEDGF